jgi:uncharacterized damage-inducible protein DinB
MIPLTVLRELYDYHYWARDRQLDACRSLSQERFLRPLGSSFSSVRDTLAHLLGAEWVWLERWKGYSPTPADLEPNRLATAQFTSLEPLQQRWREVERDLRNYLGALSDDALWAPLNYTNFRGEKWTYPLWQTLLHVANHGTYHRGQITTLLRQLGAEAPGIDLLVAYDQNFGR